MKILIFAVTLLLEALLFFEYSLSPICYILYALTIIEVILFYKKSNSLSVAGWWLYVYIVCSFLVIGSFKFIPDRFTFGSARINDSSFAVMANTSVKVMFFYFMALLVLCRQKIEMYETKWSLFAPKFNLPFVFILGFTFTLISSVIGIGKMGAENTKLPFHLSGIIQFVRTDFVPIMTLCVYANRKRLRQNTYKVIVLLFIWSLFEAMVRLSKSAIMFNFLPIIMFEILSDRKNLKQLIIRFMPVFAVVLILYPVIETMRHSDVKNAWEEADEEVTGTYSHPNDKNFIVKPFNRVFYSGFLFVTDEATVENDVMFDFKKALSVIAAGGAPRYQTFIIDGYPKGVSHSSGTSPFIDSLLMGGYGLMYISIFIMVYFAELIDRRIKRKSNFIIVVVLFVGYFRLFDMPLFTFFLNEMSIRYLLVYAGICLYIKYKYSQNKQYLQ